MRKSIAAAVLTLVAAVAAGCGPATPATTAASTPAQASAQPSTGAADKPGKTAAWCPALPSTFSGDFGGATRLGTTELPQFPPVHTMPAWNGDAKLYATQVLCVFNAHMLGITEAQRNNLPKLQVVPDGKTCPSGNQANVPALVFVYCAPQKQFLVWPNLTEQTAKAGQIQALMGAMTTFSLYWNEVVGWENLSGGMCARGRTMGGLINDGLIPASYAQLLGDEESSAYKRAAADGTCA